MRSAAILLAALTGAGAVAGTSARAIADPVRDEPDAPLRVDRDFWRDVTAPHHALIAAILARAHDALVTIDQVSGTDLDPGVLARLAVERDLVGMLGYARKFQPDNDEVLRRLAQVADDTGDARLARDALLALVDQQGLDHAGAEALDRLGELALREGRVDDAIGYLRRAQAPIGAGHAETARVLVHLATALALRGRASEAIDTLAGALPEPATFEPSELQLVGFALAVQYDRGEQRGAAYDLLQQMKTELGDQLFASIQNALDTVRFAPAEDELYYRALLYEIAEDRPQARAEWLLYAAFDDAPYRQRALEHVHDIDQLAENPLVPLGGPPTHGQLIQLLSAPPPPQPQVTP